jgi:DNA mismatch repair protein MutL
VARLTIRSRPQDAPHANEVTLAGGIPAPLKPAAANQGTTVEVRDLFFATPARLKFLKSDRAETAAITETVRRIAIAFPSVRFTLSGPDRSTLDLPSTDEDRLARIGQVLGEEFAANTIAVDATREDVGLQAISGCRPGTRQTRFRSMPSSTAGPYRTSRSFRQSAPPTRTPCRADVTRWRCSG